MLEALGAVVRQEGPAEAVQPAFMVEQEHGEELVTGRGLTQVVPVVLAWRGRRPPRGRQMSTCVSTV